MSPGESRLLQFVEARLESMLCRPAAWGSLESVEDQILQLLELRRFVLDPRADPQVSASNTQPLMRRYVRYISSVLPEATAAPLSRQLTARGRAEEFSALMRQFVQRDLTEVVAELGVSGEETLPADRLEVTARVLEGLGHAVRVRRPQEFPTPLKFPDRKAS